MIQRAGAGPRPIPHKKLSVENLRDAILFAITPEATRAAAYMAKAIRSEVSLSVHIREKTRD
jgi:sterol 3beta-glucosyltransferase